MFSLQFALAIGAVTVRPVLCGSGPGKPRMGLNLVGDASSILNDHDGDSTGHSQIKFKADYFKKNAVTLNDEEPRIEYVKRFFENDDEIDTVIGMARHMGFHRSGMLDPPARVTFLPRGMGKYT